MPIDFVTVDIETTGFSPKYDSIIAIGAVRIRDGEMAGEFYELVYTSKAIPKVVQGITGITNRDLRDARSCADVLTDFFAFLGDDIFIAHNANFDYGFIKEKGMKKLNHLMLNKCGCTMREAKRQLPDLDNYRLNTVAKRLGVPNIRHHNALNDARVSADILLSILGKKPLATQKDSPMVNLYQRITTPIKPT